MSKAISVLLVCVLSVGIYAQSNEGTGDEAAPLQVKLDVVRQVYCRSSELALELKLTYLNADQRNYIIARKAPLLASYEIVKVDSVTRARTKVLASHSNLSLGTYPGDRRVPDPKHFVVLRPGESFEIQNFLWVERLFDPKYGLGLKDGSYILNPEFVTFPYLMDPKELSWSAIGTLSASDVALPVEFTVDTAARPSQDSDVCNLATAPRITECLISQTRKNCDL